MELRDGRTFVSVVEVGTNEAEKHLESIWFRCGDSVSPGSLEVLDVCVRLVLAAVRSGVPVDTARLLPWGRSATRRRTSTSGIPTGPEIWASTAAFGRGAPTPVRVRAVVSEKVVRPVRRGRRLGVRRPEGEQ